MHVGVAPRRPEDRAATLQDAPNGVPVERPEAPLHEAVPALEDADDLHSMLPRTRDDTADHRVQARAVTARGEDPDAHPAILGREPSGGDPLGGFPLAN